jgi:hypothetical protein
MAVLTRHSLDSRHSPFSETVAIIAYCFLEKMEKL